jgi:hypothetical protein
MPRKDRDEKRFSLPLHAPDERALRVIQTGSSARKKAPTVRAVLRRYARLLDLTREAKASGCRVALVAVRVPAVLSHGKGGAIEQILDADLDLEV